MDGRRPNSLTRRSFLTATAVLPLAAQTAPARPPVCFFSKHLPELSWDQLGRWLAEAGFDGADLTVRRAGHVLPERVAEDLPRAVDAIRSHGMEVPMITTELTSASQPAARPILSTAARLRIPFFKLGYWPYGDDPELALRQAREGARSLVELAREYGITAGFHNHAGRVGLAGWDGQAVLQELDPKRIGYYYDAQNATQEGAVAGWEVALRLALPRLKMAACKDFYWTKSNGKWMPLECPLGEGMVNWSKVFGLLASVRFNGPISVHQEYAPADRLKAARQDLAFVRKHLQSVSAGSAHRNGAAAARSSEWT
jgi:sugar phosphate isomerase/epimerase